MTVKAEWIEYVTERRQHEPARLHCIFFILDFQQSKENQIFPLQPSTPTFHYIIALVLHLYSVHERWNSFKSHVKNGSF